MSASPQTDVIVIGGGPGGYTAAQRCAGRGLRTTLIERGPLGGTCLNVGCIPSKALIHAASSFSSLADASSLAAIGITVAERRLDWEATQRWKESVVSRLQRGVAQLLDGASVEVVAGTAEVVDPGTVLVRSGDEQVTVSCRALIIATGSAPARLANLADDPRVIDSTAMLAIDRVPQRLVVVGGGYIGLELGTAFRKLGSAVTVVEFAERVLPQFDDELVRPVERSLQRLGIDVLGHTSADRMTPDGLAMRAADGTMTEVAADTVLVTVGRRPLVSGFGLERLGLVTDDGPIAIDARCRTAIPGVYAIGDVTGEPMLAHRAIAQADLVADVIAGDAAVEWDHLSVPAVCFTDPELFSVGCAPASEYVVGRASFKANGRALTLGDDNGFVRVIADPSSSVVLGVQAVGPHVSELSSSASLAVEMRATLGDVLATIVAHPTLGETVHDAIADTRLRLRQRSR